MRSRVLAAAGVAILLSAANFCASAPAAKKTATAAPAEIPPEATVRGREMAARLFARDSLIADQRLLRYVNLVGHAAAAGEPDRPKLHFAVTQSGVPYELALPGGFVVLSRGALALMSSEAELAVALAREICREKSGGTTSLGGPEESEGESGDAALEARWDACGASLAAAAGYDAAAFLHYLASLEDRAVSARERLDLQLRMDLYRKLPESSQGGQLLADRFRRSAMS